MFRDDPGAPARAVMVTVACTPAARCPTSQMTSLPRCAHRPRSLRTSNTVTIPGARSATIASAGAASGPRLRTVSVYVNVAPASTRTCDETFRISRSYVGGAGAGQPATTTAPAAWIAGSRAHVSM